MKHIAIDARIISSTTGRYVERLLYHLEQIDTTNRYSILIRKKDEDYWKPTNPNFTLVVAEFDNYSLSEQTGLLRLLNQLKPDLVHFCTPEQPVLYRGKKVTTIHDLILLKTYNPHKNWFIFKTKQFIGRFVFSHVARTSEFVFTPSNFTRKEILDRFSVDKNRIITTYLAAEARTTELTPYPLPGNNYIMFVGQQSRYKNIRFLQQVHEKLLETHPDLLLVLVGKLDKPGLDNKAYFESRQAKNIIYTGYVDDGQLNWLYSNTKAYVFPSLMEGFGLPGLEAMAQGAAVASSNATCLPEVYGDAAIYFDPTNIDDAVHAIEQLLSNKNLRTTLHKNSAALLKKYSWKETAKLTHSYYIKALEDNTKG
jgi:glycosyltransferase involved in cell wall biosynthesis